MRLRWLFWAGFWAFLIDQISKYVVVHTLQLSQVLAIDVVPPILNLRYGENRGINFGLFDWAGDAMRWVLIGLSLAIIVVVIAWVSRRRHDRRVQVSAGLLVGGALGNVVDRLLYGYVLDFLNMSCCGIDNPFVFNLADVFIFVGAVGLVYFDPGAGAGKNGDRRRKKPA